MTGARFGVTLAAVALLFADGVGAEEDEWSVCRIESILPDGEKIEFTGFKVKGGHGIYTALHGVQGAAKVSGIFHDPKTRRVRLQLAEVDIDRDIALLVPAAGEKKDSLPAGGLGLGVWPPPERREAKLAGGKATVIGFPWGIDLRTATTKLTIRKPAVAQLTELLNPSARKELKQRGSPDTGADMLSLQGAFLPGHSGAPILDADGAVIGIGIGGLGEGKVGHGWAAPFHEIELKPVGEPAVAKILAALPVHQSTYTFSLVVDEDDRKKPAGKAGVKTVVESNDGSPILALRQKPGDELKGELDRLRKILEAIGKGENDKFTAQGEAARIMKNRLYLPSGTEVEVLSEPEAFKVPPTDNADGDGGLGRALDHLYARVRVLIGKTKGETLWVPSGAIRRRAGQ